MMSLLHESCVTTNCGLWFLYKAMGDRHGIVAHPTLGFCVPMRQSRRFMAFTGSAYAWNAGACFTTSTNGQLAVRRAVSLRCTKPWSRRQNTSFKSEKRNDIIQATRRPAMMRQGSAAGLASPNRKTIRRVPENGLRIVPWTKNLSHKGCWFVCHGSVSRANWRTSPFIARLTEPWHTLPEAYGTVYKTEIVRQAASRNALLFSFILKGA